MSARIIPYVVDTSERKSGRFFILLSLPLVASPQGFSSYMVNSFIHVSTFFHTFCALLDPAF